MRSCVPDCVRVVRLSWTDCCAFLINSLCCQSALLRRSRGCSYVARAAGCACLARGAGDATHLCHAPVFALPGFCLVPPWIVEPPVFPSRAVRVHLASLLELTELASPAERPRLRCNMLRHLRLD